VKLCVKVIEIICNDSTINTLPKSKFVWKFQEYQRCQKWSFNNRKLGEISGTRYCPQVTYTSRPKSSQLETFKIRKKISTNWPSNLWQRNILLWKAVSYNRHKRCLSFPCKRQKSVVWETTSSARGATTGTRGAFHFHARGRSRLFGKQPVVQEAL
jgi:hypothetical protein